MADEALIEAERRYRSLFEEAPISLWEEDFTGVGEYLDQLQAGGVGDLGEFLLNNPAAVGECACRVRVLDVNRGTLELYGAADKQEFFANLDRFFCGESYPFFIEELLAIANGETAFQGETVNLTLQGKKLHVFLKWIVASENQHDFSRVIVSIVDITERKQAEETLEENLERLDVAQETAGIGFWDLDLSDMKLTWTKGLKSVFELDPDGPTPTYDEFWTYVHPDNLEFVERQVEKQLKPTGGLITYVYKIATKRGNVKYLDHRGRQILDDRGRLIRLYGSVQDITERKAAEKELRVRSEELDAFAHSVSHDLMSVLTLVEGFSLTAMEANEKGNTEEERESLNHIVRATKRMEGYVDGLLQYARAVRQEGQASRVETEEVLMGVLVDLEEALRQGGVQVILKEDLPPIMASPIKLRQVFLNLIANSLRYTGNNPEPRIEVGAGSEGGIVTLYVKDNGVGVPRDKLEAIFLPFERLGNSPGSGMGIGLATVKRAVEAWGGKVWVESELGKGSAFFFSASSAGE